MNIPGQPQRHERQYYYRWRHSTVTADDTEALAELDEQARYRCTQYLYDEFGNVDVVKVESEQRIDEKSGGIAQFVTFTFYTRPEPPPP